MTISKLESRKPTLRQIIFNWLTGEDIKQPGGCWGTSDQVALVDDLLAELTPAITQAAEERVREKLVKTFRDRADGAANTPMMRWAAPIYRHMAEEAAALPLSTDAPDEASKLRDH